MKTVPAKDQLQRGSASAMSVTYTAILAMREETVSFLAGLLGHERRRRATRAQTRALTCLEQAVLVIRWFLDGTRLKQLAIDNAIGKSTAYDYLHEGIDVLVARAPKLESVLLAAKMAGYAHVSIDGTVDRNRPVRHAGTCPRRGSVVAGKHAGHGGNIQWSPP